MTTTIEVRISSLKIVQLEHGVHIGNYTMRELRAAGIPVQGTLGVTRVDDGVLTVRTVDDDLVFTWRGEDPLIQEIW